MCVNEIVPLEFDYNADDARGAVETYKKKVLKTTLKSILNNIATEATKGRLTLSENVPIKHSDFCLEQLRLRGFFVEVSSSNDLTMLFNISWKERKD